MCSPGHHLMWEESCILHVKSKYRCTWWPCAFSLLTPESPLNWWVRDQKLQNLQGLYMLLLDRASLDYKSLSICKQYYRHLGKPGCSLGILQWRIPCWIAMEEETICFGNSCFPRTHQAKGKLSTTWGGGVHYHGNKHSLWHWLQSVEELRSWAPLGSFFSSGQIFLRDYSEQPWD